LITGIVNDRLEATVPIIIVTPAGNEAAVTAIIDTGYNGYLAVPSLFAQTIGCPMGMPRMVQLGDGSVRPVAFFNGTVRWNDSDVSIPLLATDDEFLLGTGLLDGLHLDVVFRVGEAVTIAPG
jgi:clan AA aspartic protease